MMKMTTTMFGTHAVHAPQVKALAGLVHWSVNPRHENEAEVEAMKESLEAVGQLDDVHVWKCVDGDKILRGNRRVCAMRELRWTECRQVVHEFSDERDAYRFLLEDHAPGRVVALTAEERIVSVENGVRLGMTVSDLHAVGGSERMTQLYWDLGKGLPVRAREALRDDRLGIGVAALILKITDPKERERATREILAYEGEGEPMPFKQAKAVIEMQWLLPERYELEWIELCAKLKKKLPVINGYSYVAFKNREDFVMGWRGTKEDGYEYGDEPMPGDKDGRTWAQVAVAAQVPIYVCPAPEAKTGYVTLVSAKMLKPVTRKTVRTEQDEPREEVDAPAPDVVKNTTTPPVVKEERPPFDLERWRRVMSAMLEKTRIDAVRGDGMWKEIAEAMWFEVHELSGLPAETLQAMREENERDESPRRTGMRWTLLWCLALVMVRRGGTCAALEEIESVLLLPPNA